MAADEVAPARAVWRLGDYHRFACEGKVVTVLFGYWQDALPWMPTRRTAARSSRDLPGGF
jgi:hypothetical protein